MAIDDIDILKAPLAELAHVTVKQVAELRKVARATPGRARRYLAWGGTLLGGGLAALLVVKLVTSKA